MRRHLFRSMFIPAFSLALSAIENAMRKWPLSVLALGLGLTIACADGSGTPEPTSSPTGDEPSPGKVAGVWAAGGGGSGEIEVSWNTSPEPDVDHYNVYRSTTLAGPYELVGSVSNDQQPLGPDTVRLGEITLEQLRERWFVDTDRLETHCYVVTAVAASGTEGPTSNEACGHSPIPSGDDRLPPGKVIGLEAGAGAGSGEIQLTWNASPEQDASYYQVYWAAGSDGPYHFLVSVSNDEVAILAPGTRGFIDAEVSGARCYVVAPVDETGNQGPESDVACGRSE